MVVVWIILILIGVSFGLVTFIGAPYVPTFERDLRVILQELKLPKKALVIDLGSGDGKLLVLAAKRGYQVIGYEVNPFLYLISRWRLRKYPSAQVKLRNLWKADVSSADFVFCFLATRFMPKLETKLLAEMKPGSYLASYVFALPSIEVIKKNRNTYFYRF